MRRSTLFRAAWVLAAGLVALSCGGKATVESGGTTTTTTTGSGGAAGQCNASNCDPQHYKCCGELCTNPNNDILNCGSCDNPCSGAHAYCADGSCTAPPCDGQSCTSPSFCCGGSCCPANQLCCDVPGPVDYGPQCMDATAEFTCPVGCEECMCASPDTPILTPEGERPIAELKVGDLVYSRDSASVVVVPVLRTSRHAAAHHQVVRLRLASGAVLEVSAPHPTADGRTFADLRAGGDLDGVLIVERTIIPYRSSYTYDILPASDTGTYFAGGVLVGSTLATHR